MIALVEIAGVLIQAWLMGKVKLSLSWQRIPIWPTVKRSRYFQIRTDSHPTSRHYYTKLEKEQAEMVLLSLLVYFVS